MLTPRDPAFRDRVARLFTDAPFVRDVGIQLVDCGPGWVEATLALAPRHLQQDGVVHAGVQATLADHAAGAAAGTLMGADDVVLSVEFKIHLLRAARGERLRCRAEVLRPGRQIVAVEASVWTLAGGEERLTSKLTGTMTYVRRAPDR